ncbi:hypothetical protein [Sphaerisporangium rubeum]|uniref:Uncharacterized protein n=1 Tax=Sphaerisporangium rubeum TaxID=321317 RepID=A0A7X0M589_9ACTN|nr:hypothetical protein [Sphaerisporangium rubeum]MBB6470631.1 hypothetical protein [Sphaerisporangium rubeum]
MITARAAWGTVVRGTVGGTAGRGRGPRDPGHRLGVLVRRLGAPGTRAPRGPTSLAAGRARVALPTARLGRGAALLLAVPVVWLGCGTVAALGPEWRRAASR